MIPLPVAVPSSVAPAMEEIVRGMDLKKCRKCGCMKEALDGAEKAFGNSDDRAVNALLPAVRQFQARMDTVAYDCIGCKKCWGADATIALADNFPDLIEADSCGGGFGPPSPADAPVVRMDTFDAARLPWPPYPGDYVLGDPLGTVAICTLSNRNLPAQIVRNGESGVAVAGRCDTENIGVEKVVLNLLANPQVRHLILCGEEAKGHRTGDAFLNLKERGVDANMRVLESASWRPILKNLTLVDVARFREQIEVVNLIGVTDLTVILAAVREAVARPLPPLTDYAATDGLNFDRIVARAPERLKLDPAGFFIVLPQSDGRIICEHYENNGRLTNVIEGRQAALIAATAVERGLVTRLDHAAYLGRELAKAEMSFTSGGAYAYEQDAALGNLRRPDAALKADESNERNTCAANCGAGCR